ncbi:MAG: FAD binding domain-containing protein, partial [Chloroflexota bacterium]
MWEAYHNVSRVDEALALLDEHGERARIIAGGTDILIELEQGKRPDVDVLIDITRIANLDAVEEDGDFIRLGALVNHNHVVGSDLLREHALPLVQASWEVGAPQIRNRATVAGNLITGSSANDTITPLTALGAEIELRSIRETRTIPISEFYTGLRQTVMRSNEMLTAIRIPKRDEKQRGVFIKLGLRRAQAISVVNCAVVLSQDADGTVTRASIALGSVAPTIIRVPLAEFALVGNSLSESTIREAALAAGDTPTPIDDVRSTATYRSEMVKVLVARALRKLALDDVLDTIPQQPAMLWGANEARVNGNALATAQTHTENAPINATINGESVIVNSGQMKTLLDWLRDHAGLTGTKQGCAEGECGACTVFLDGVAVMSCMVAAPRADGADIVTIEGLKQADTLHPVQQAFVETGAYNTHTVP